MAQTCRSHAVEEPEVDSFGELAVLRADLLFTSDALGGYSVDVLACGEGPQHRLVATDLSGDPELYLGLVGLHQHPALGSPDVSAELGREVLQVGRGAGHPAGTGPYLPPGGVESTFLDLLQQLATVGAHQLGGLTVLEKG